MPWYKAFFSLHGRLNRQGFWVGFGVCGAILLFVANLMPYKFWYTNITTAVYPTLILIMVAWCVIALGVKRLHDRGRSGKGVFMLIFPFICPLVAPSTGILGFLLNYFLPLFICVLLLLDWGVFKGQIKPNQYGDQGQPIRFL